MAVLGGLCEKLVSEVKSTIQEPSNTKKITPNDILFRAASAYTDVLVDIQSMADRDCLLELDYDISSSATEFRVRAPAGCSNIRHILVLDAADNILGTLRPLRQYDRVGIQYGYEIQGPYIRLLKPPGVGTSTPTMRVVYEPFGYMPLHYGTLDATNSALVDQTNGLWVHPNQATLVYGQKDYRLNGYVGAWFRVYETSTAPTGYSDTTYNMDEQLVVDFTETTQRLTLQNALTFPTLVAKGGTWKFEIVPYIDWGIWECVVFKIAAEYASKWRPHRAGALLQQYQLKMRTARFIGSEYDSNDPSQFDRRKVRSFVW